MRIYAQTPILYLMDFFALYADNPQKQAFQCTHKQKIHHRMVCALRKNSKFGSIHTSITVHFFFGNLRHRNTQNHPKTLQTPPKHYLKHKCEKIFFRTLTTASSWGVGARAPSPSPPPPPVRHWHCAIIHTVIGLNDRQLF